MSLVGSIFSFNFDKCFCFMRKKTKKDGQKAAYEKRLMSLQFDMDVKVLPFLSFLPLTDIFPQKNHVSEWSVYIIGKNKRLVVAQDNLHLSDESMLNKKFDSILEGKNGEFFNLVFDMIINGHETQFLMVVNNQLYFANTYTFMNEEKKPIGGILFVRLYSSMDELVPKNHDMIIDVRKSREYARALQVIQETRKSTEMGSVGQS